MCCAPKTFEVDRGEGVFEEVTVSCSECWQCRTERVNDYVGRALAEAATSDHTCAVTLTYASGHEGAPEKVLHKRHFQNFIRALRDSHHRLRYLCVSEGGEKNGRIHFHAILFFKGNRPDWAQAKKINVPHWPWGFLWADWNADHRALRYVLKYVLKHADKGIYWKTSSLKPALGHDWFMAKAEQNLEHGVLPSSFLYLPPNGRQGVRYRMSGATRRNYINRIADGLRLQGRCPLSISNEHIAKAVDRADSWAIDRETRLMLNAMSEEQRESYVAEEMAKMRKRLDHRSMTDLQAERYLNKLQIQLCLGAVDDFDALELDTARHAVAWSEPYQVEY